MLISCIWACWPWKDRIPSWIAGFQWKMFHTPYWLLLPFYLDLHYIAQILFSPCLSLFHYCNSIDEKIKPTIEQFTEHVHSTYLLPCVFNGVYIQLTWHVSLREATRGLTLPTERWPTSDRSSSSSTSVQVSHEQVPFRCLYIEHFVMFVLKGPGNCIWQLCQIHCISWYSYSYTYS